MKNAIIFMHGIKASAIIGVSEEERKQPSMLFIDLDIACDISKAAASDQLSDTHDYAAIAQALQQRIQQSRYYLLEALAEDLRVFLEQQFGISRLRLKLSKQNIVSNTKEVGLMIDCLQSESY